MFNVSILFSDSNKFVLRALEEMLISEDSKFDTFQARSALGIKPLDTWINDETIEWNKYEDSTFNLSCQFVADDYLGLMRLVKAIAKKFTVDCRFLYYSRDLIGHGYGTYEFLDNGKYENKEMYFSPCQEGFQWWCENLRQDDLEDFGYRLNTNGKWEDNYWCRDENGNDSSFWCELPEKDTKPHWFLRERLNRPTP